ncbi:hypothetical protein [Nocardia salmonicida]|uniref:hypothetical protein n=1 Tax=Nocardia salmonicida TaxID=53431 RepID=UPI00364E3312
MNRVHRSAALDKACREPSPLDGVPLVPVAGASWWVEPVLVADTEHRFRAASAPTNTQEGVRRHAGALWFESF